jgi:hypothetical protein
MMSFSPWCRWVSFLDEREPATSLALFRIACGLGTLGAVGGVVLDGLVSVIWFDQADGGMFALAADPPWLFRLLGGLTPVNVWAMVITALLSGLLLVLGVAGPLPALLALQAYQALAGINPRTGGSDNYLLLNSLWLLVFARANQTLSLSCRWRTGRWVDLTPVPAWPRYLAIFQLVLVYTVTGIEKAGIHWSAAGDYAALYCILQSPSWQRCDMSWLAWVYPLTQVGTVLARCWEVSAPLLLLDYWDRNSSRKRGVLRRAFHWLHFRRIFVAGGLALHLGIFLTMNVEPFTWVALSYYASLFRPEEWHAAWRWLRRRSPATDQASPTRSAKLVSSRPVRDLRGLFVAFHLVAITLIAFPNPGQRSDAEWDNPTTWGEMADWSQRLRSWGFEVTPEGLHAWARNFTGDYMSVRTRLLAPFSPYYEYCGTYQSWHMFVGVNRLPTRLYVELEEDGVWRPIYVERDPRYTWRGSWLAHSRLRPVLFSLGMQESKERYRQLVSWLAGLAARDYPGATRLRVSFYQFPHVPTPEEVREDRIPRGRFVQVLEVELGSVLRRIEEPRGSASRR